MAKRQTPYSTEAGVRMILFVSQKRYCAQYKTFGSGEALLIVSVVELNRNPKRFRSWRGDTFSSFLLPLYCFIDLDGSLYINPKI